ncbi:hypothetical protein LUZ61_013935 [Rhynchospora tenuis]|uniref:Uncharacterized protein n=1 Tax=Rhynchospora tenuis TaxID=198213 RepID=A0AAD5Z2Z4_9POAL|nr:hypothetical protein LUZ61_013935 [Rhynchospora tenuis]
MDAAALKFALDKLSNVLLNMGLEMYNVSDEIGLMQLELEIIEGFLQDAYSKRNRNPAVKRWVNQVRDVAYKIEDAIDIFLAEIGGNLPWNKLEMLVKKPFKVKKLVKEVKAIRKTLNTISKCRTDLGITNTAADSEENDQIPFRPTRPSHFDDSEIVGLDNDKQQIIGRLLDTTNIRRTVLSIVGIGGLGKTTLAQKVYKSAELEGRFNWRIWLSISQNFNVEYLLRKMLYSVQPDLQNKQQAIEDDDLTSNLQKSLAGKCYFIVLDDVWTTDLWENLKISLPEENNGSRILITSRSLDVAMAANGGTEPYKLRYLNKHESLELLFKKAFPVREPEFHRYHTVLNKVAKQLVKKCGGLPLALIVLGSILSRRERTCNAWQRVNETLNWHDKAANRCSEVLLLSYVDLPYYLKSCFLYFASFPEDYKISAKHVMRMWIAEGFVPRYGKGTIEDRAQNYFDELIQRCLLQSAEKSWNGNCKRCLMHDLVREMAIHEAREENFFTVFSKAEDDGCQLAVKKVRRATLQYKPPTNFDIRSTDIRSLLVFGIYKFKNRGFRLLRVLCIERFNFHHYEIFHQGWLEGLTHLRYLGFRYCDVPLQFKFLSFSSLKNLETVDFKRTSFHSSNLVADTFNSLCRPIVGHVFHSLWKLPSLRHAIFGFRMAPPLPSKADHLKNIDTLKWVYLREIPILDCHINLRTIGIRTHGSYDRIQESLQNIKDLLKRTVNLVCLSLHGHPYVPLLSEGIRDLPCHKTIQSLFFSGEWARDLCVLNLRMFPINLTKLALIWSKMEDDPMPVLERLQSLKVLKLLDGAFQGRELTCTEGGFPVLQNLVLKWLNNLSHWNIKEGAMPRLTQLKIVECFQMQVLPDLQNVPTLQDLTLDKSHHERTMAEDNYKIKHIPSVHT